MVTVRPYSDNSCGKMESTFVGDDLVNILTIPTGKMKSSFVGDGFAHILKLPMGKNEKCICW